MLASSGCARLARNRTSEGHSIYGFYERLRILYPPHQVSNIKMLVRGFILFCIFRDIVDIHIKNTVLCHDNVLDTGFFHCFTQGHIRNIRFAIRMSAKTNPDIQKLMMVY